MPSRFVSVLVGSLLCLYVFVIACSSKDKPLPRVTSTKDIGAHVGEDIEVLGRVNGEISQHVLEYPDGYNYSTYISLDDGDIVVYSKDKITCKAGIRLTGTVVNILRAPVNMAKSETSEVWQEYQLKAKYFGCI